MDRDKSDATDEASLDHQGPLTRQAAEDFVTGMLRSLRSYPVHDDVLKYREQIELCSTLPEAKDCYASDNPTHGFDITYNTSKLRELVDHYEQSQDPYALDVLLTIFHNALTFSRPIPGPMTRIVRRWVNDGASSPKRRASPLRLGRDSLLVAAIRMLQHRAGIIPTRSTATVPHDSGCDIAARIWSKIAEERKAHGEEWPTATYDIARDAWKEYRRACGGNSGTE